MRRWLKRLSNNLLNLYCSRTLVNCGEGLFVGGFSRFTPATIIGSYCSFNGIKVLGRGSVSIGDYFHSGSKCQILTENHNISGDSIPYDDTYIIKAVSIGKCVWFGNNVIVLPGVGNVEPELPSALRPKDHIPKIAKNGLVHNS